MNCGSGPWLHPGIYPSAMAHRLHQIGDFIVESSFPDFYSRFLFLIRPMKIPVSSRCRMTPFIVDDHHNATAWSRFPVSRKPLLPSNAGCRSGCPFKTSIHFFKDRYIIVHRHPFFREWIERHSFDKALERILRREEGLKEMKQALTSREIEIVQSTSVPLSQRRSLLLVHCSRLTAPVIAQSGKIMYSKSRKSLFFSTFWNSYTENEWFFA